MLPTSWQWCAVLLMAGTEAAVPSSKLIDLGALRGGADVASIMVKERRYISGLWATQTIAQDVNCSELARQLPRPMMTGNEVNLMQSLLQGKEYFVEYGAGSSTERFAPLVKFTVSIESSASWCREVFSRPIFNCLINSGRLDVICMALGETREFATPMNWTEKHHLANFHLYVRGLTFANFPRYDVVLVDGRFRVAIALYILRYIDQNTLVAVHDFYDRPHYHVLLQVYDLVKAVDTMAVLKRKPMLSSEELEMWKQYLLTWK